MMDRPDYEEPLVSRDREGDPNPGFHSGFAHYKDVLYLFLFVVNVLSTLAIAVSYGVVALGAADHVVEVRDSVEYDESPQHTSVRILLGMVTALAVAFVLTLAWILTLSRIATYIINTLLMGVIMVPIVSGFAVFALGFYTMGTALVALAVGVLLASLCMRPRMDFAATNLKVACSALLAMPTTFVYALLLLLAQLAYSVLWAVAAVGFATSSYNVTVHAQGQEYHLDQCTTYLYSSALALEHVTLTCSGKCTACVCDSVLVVAGPCASPRVYPWACIWLLLSFFWTSAVLSNIVHCTTCSAVAAWWGSPEGSLDAEGAVQAGFKRATGPSLGSLCLGSLLVAIVRTVRSLLHFGVRQAQRVSAPPGLSHLLACILRLALWGLAILDWVVTFFSRYALCFVAIYGADFATASRSAAALFADSGWAALLNGDIVDVVLGLGHLVIGATAMASAHLYARLSGLPQVYSLLLTVFGFAAGYMVSTVALTPVSSAVSSVYVCFVDNPQALQ
ncbi:plasma-membrane choline transporter-domain-containing protein, partial [Ochromonadaceae sp. CCMP2298]